LLCEVLMNGQSIGKKIMKIRVISLEGGEPTLGQFVLRWITKFFEWPFLFAYIAFSYDDVVSYIFITCFCAIPVVILVLATKKKQRLGDLAAGTTVVQTKTELRLEDTIFINVANENYKPTFPEVMKLSDNDINTINTILSQTKKNMNYELCQRVEYKVKDVLDIKTNLYGVAFLKKLMEDYNYLATREN
jgi:RDD family